MNKAEVHAFIYSFNRYLRAYYSKRQALFYALRMQ